MWMDLPEGRIAYTDEGSGPTMLFVHFGPVWSFVWSRTIPELSASFRCVTVDLPGAGASPPTASFRPDVVSASRVIDAFCGRLDLDRPILVAHDLGVAAGLLAMIHGRSFSGAVLVDSFAWSLDDHDPKVARMLRFVGGPFFTWLNAWTNVLARATSGRAGVGRHLSREERRRFRAPYDDRRVRRASTGALGAAATVNEDLRLLEDRLRGADERMPILLVYGEKSPVVKEGFPERFRELLPRAEMLVVPGAHHFPQMDDGPRVAATICAWWKDSIRQP